MIELPDRRQDTSRLSLLLIAMPCLFVLLLCRLWYLQIALGPELAEKAQAQRKGTIRRIAPRGIITDRNGRLLATNTPHFVVSVIPAELQKNKQVLPRLAEILHLGKQELGDLIDENKLLLAEM